MPVSLFFHNIGPNLAQVLPLRPHTFAIFLLISNKMLGDSIKIKTGVATH